MSGLLSHLIVSLIGFFVLFLIFKKWRYGIAFLIGQLIPDVLRYGITAAANGTLDFETIINQPLFMALEFTHYIYVWAILYGLFFAIIFLLYNRRIIKLDKYETWFVTEVIFLSSIAFHLIVDLLLVDKGYLIL